MLLVSSVVCPVCVSGVLSSASLAPLSPSFLAAKYFVDQCDYTTKKSLDLLFAPTAVGLGTAV